MKQGGRSIFAIVALVCLVQHLNGTVLLNSTACYVVVKYCYGMELETHKWVEWRNLWWLLQFPQTTHLTPSEILIGLLPKFNRWEYFCNDFVFRNFPTKSCTHLQNKKYCLFQQSSPLKSMSPESCVGLIGKGLKLCWGSTNDHPEQRSWFANTSIKFEQQTEMKIQDSLQKIIQSRYHSSPIQCEHRTVLNIHFLQIIINHQEHWK